ncbi:MAG TPA: histidine kinase dimerization/phospho-acceptor domain-containing protein, partial [Negativicutes bacterium]|nr:histidine kinase dimerization/phospho-acceptor domain-containing protein [Negativicutes bacterium]
MVRELRRILTVINTAVILTVFLLLVAGSYCFLQATTDRSTAALLTALTGFCIAGGLFACGASFFLAGRVLAPIREAWQRQQDFMADASHELRAPLTVIRTNLDVVRDSPEETVASQDKWLENIREETVSMA